MSDKFFKKYPQLPNLITISRLLAVPIIILLLQFGHGDPITSKIAAIAFLTASLTDLLDGYLARRYGQVTNLGAFLDPLADKLLAAAAMIMLIPLSRIPAWVVFLILTREMAITGLRSIAAEKGLVISASSQGKQKTLAQNIAIFCLLWHYPLLTLNSQFVGLVILYLALAITYWSGIGYVRHFWQQTGGRA